MVAIIDYDAGNIKSVEKALQALGENAVITRDKACILELGAGMEYPSVIRFPFEKVAFFNQKSVFYRVHGKLPFLTEELSERGFSIKTDAITFLSEEGNQG